MPYGFQLARFSDFLRKVIGGKGHVGLQAIEDVQPSLDLRSTRPEDFWLRKEKLQWGFLAVGAAVGQFTHVGLFNTVPGLLRVCTRVQILPTAAVNVHLALTAFPPLGPAASGVNYMDGRSWNPTTGVASTVDDPVRGTSSAGALVPIPFKRIPGIAQLFDLPVGVVLVGPVDGLSPTGTSLIVENSGVNSALSVGFEWYDLPFNAEELRG